MLDFGSVMAFTLKVGDLWKKYTPSQTNNGLKNLRYT